jgi:hypothetical protein
MVWLEFVLDGIVWSREDGIRRINMAHGTMEEYLRDFIANVHQFLNNRFPMKYT